MSAVLERTHEARLEALARANEVRFARATLKRDLRNGTVDVARVIADPADCLHTMRVHDLLRALPGWGPWRTRRLMGLLRVSDAKTLRGLSDRQRGELLAALSGATAVAVASGDAL